MFKELFLFLLAVILLFAIYRLLHKNKVQVEYNPQAPIAEFISKMKSLNKPFAPTPWLFNCHFQTVWGMRYRKKPRNEPRREQYIFEDKGNTFLDWFETDQMTETTPIVVISHTLAGGTREPVVKNFAMTCVKKGWRVVVANHRGCSGAKISSGRIYNAIQIDDLHNIILRTREEFKPSHVVLVGFSLGALQSLQYSAKLADPQIVDAICVVSHTYDSLKGSLHLRDWPQKKLYTPIIMYQLKHAIDKASSFFPPELVAEAKKTNYMNDFDDVFTAKLFGLKGAAEYYSMSNCYPYIPQAKVPTLILGSDDDPFTMKECMPLKECKEAQNVALVHTAEGGHVSFIEGIKGDHSLIDRILPDFIDAVISK